MKLKDIIEKLSEPMPYKWRVQSFSKHKPQATCVAYIDARDVMQRLDAHCVWQREHREIKGHIYAGIGILIDGQWVWRWDCGTESNTEAEKGESSDSFKRAAVNFGVGRFLYDLGMVYLPANEKKTQGNYPYVVDGNGKQVYDLTKHINGMDSKKPISPPRSTPPPKPEPQTAKRRLWIASGQDKDRIAAAAKEVLGVNDTEELTNDDMLILVDHFGAGK